MGKYSNILQNQSGGGKYSKMLKSSTISSAVDTEDTNAPLIGEFPEQVVSGGKMSDTVSKDRPLSKEQIAYAKGLPQTSVKDDRVYLGAGYKNPTMEERDELWNAVTLKDGIETLTKGMEQFGTQGALNQMSGALNMALGIGHIATSPFNIADKSLRAMGGVAKTFAEVTAYPFEKIGEGVATAEEYIGKGLDDFLMRRGVAEEDRKAILNLGIDEKEIAPLKEALQGSNQFLAQILAGKVMHSTSNIIKKIGAPKATEIIKQGKDNGLTIPEIDELYSEKIDALQTLYNERNVRLNQRDKLVGANQKFMDMLVGKLDEQITPLEKELGVKATKIETVDAVKDITQEVPVIDLIKKRAEETQRELPPSYIEQGLGVQSKPYNRETSLANNQAFIEGTNRRLIPEAEKLTSDLPSLEEAKIGVANRPETVQNSPISSLEAQGKEITPKPIESIAPQGETPTNALKETVFGESVKDEITNLNSANDAIKFAEKYKGNEEVLNELQLERDNLAKQGKEAVINDLPGAETLIGRASILNDAVNEMKKGEENVTNEFTKNEFKKPNDSGALYTTIIPLPHPETLRAIKSSFDQNLPVVKDVLARGGKLAYEGVRDFKDWSAEMTKLYGDAIQPHLQRVWLQVQNTGRNDNEFNRQLVDYARTNKIMPEKFTRAGKEIDINKTAANIKEMIERGASEEEFSKVIAQQTFESPQEQARYEFLLNKKSKELSGGDKLTTNEVKEYENLRAKTFGDLESKALDNFRAKHKVIENNPILKGAYEIKFERARKAEIEAISLKTNFDDLIEASRQSSGDRYDTRVLKALAGEKIKLTVPEQKLYEALVQFRTEAGKLKVNAKLIKDYDFPLMARKFVEAYFDKGLVDAIKEKFKKVDAREIDHLMRSYSQENMFDIYSMKRFGRTENPTMDLKLRLPNYIDIFTIQKNLEPIMPTITRLEKAMKSANLPNNVLWLQKYTKELFSEPFELGFSGEKQINKAVKVLNNVASIRWLALNPSGGLGNLIGGLYQNWVSPDLTLKQKVVGTKRLFSQQGYDILTERGIIDATGAGKSIKKSDLTKQVFNPYLAYSAGEHVIQGQFYLGKLTPEEFRSKIISASRDRQILEGKADAQGAYHKGLRPDIVRTTLGAGMMKFRLWLPAVLESKAQKLFSVGRLFESAIKGKDNLTTKDIKNLKATLTEATTIGASVLLLNEIPEDKREFLESALNNAYGFLKGESLARQTSNALPAAQTVTDIFIALSLIGEPYKIDSDYGAEGEDKGVGYFKKMAPVVIKPLLKYKPPKEIQEINELSSAVEKFRKRAIEGSTKDADIYNRLKEQLEMKKEDSRLYQQRLEKKQLESERIQEKLNQ